MGELLGATAIHGTIGQFDSTQKDWTSYIERLQQYFTANDVAEDKQRAMGHSMPNHRRIVRTPLRF